MLIYNNNVINELIEIIENIVKNEEGYITITEEEVKELYKILEELQEKFIGEIDVFMTPIILPNKKIYKISITPPKRKRYLKKKIIEELERILERIEKYNNVIIICHSKFGRCEDNYRKIYIYILI